MKHKKEFFGVLISVLVCVFLVYLFVYATTVGTDITVTGDTTVSGNDLTFGNGAAFDNATSNDLLLITESLVSIAGNASVSGTLSVTGDVTITGNDLTFGNAAVLSNQDADWLTLTESNVSVSGDLGISGNDLKFGNGAAFDNATSNDLLLITESLVSIVGKASVSTDLYVTGNTILAGDALFSGNASTSGDFTITSGARIGNSAGTTHITVLGGGTLFVEGDAEFDNVVYFDRSVAIGIIGEETAEPATELSVVGTASISEDLWASGSFQFGGGETAATVSYSRLGGTATGHGLSNANDLVVNGSLEVDGTAYFDGASVSFGGLASISGVYNDDWGEYEIIRHNTAYGVIAFTEQDGSHLAWLDLVGEAGSGTAISLYTNGVTGTSPYMLLIADYANTLTKIRSTTQLLLQTSNDTDDYLQFQTTSNVPEIVTAGTCDLKIIPDGGDLYLDATVSVSDSLRVAGISTFNGVASVSDTTSIQLGAATIDISTSEDTASMSGTCVTGSLHLNIASGTLQYCDVNSDWSPVDDD